MVAPLHEAELYRPGDHYQRALRASVDLEHMLTAAAGGLPKGAVLIFLIGHSGPRTCETADFAYGRPRGPYWTSTVRI